MFTVSVRFNCVSVMALKQSIVQCKLLISASGITVFVGSNITDATPIFSTSAHCSGVVNSIGLYRDVWIAAIASSRTRLATLTGAMCKTSQCELRSLRVNSGILNVILIVTYYTLPPLESPTSSWIAMAISR